MRIIAKSAPHLYKSVLAELLTNGTRSSPRGRKTRERIATHLTLTDPRRNIITSEKRDLNYAFMIAEWLFIMSGSNNANWLTPFNKNIGSFADKEPNTFAGAYGPKIIEQLPYVVQTLKADPDSRQAVITIWRERPRQSPDIPCTVSLQFLLRAGCLSLITNMRSNDAWLGLPYDVFNFTQLQRVVAFHLNAHLGEYHHFVGSMHLYDENIEKAKAVVDEDYYYDEKCVQPEWRVCSIDALVAAYIEVATTDWNPPHRRYDPAPYMWDKYYDKLDQPEWRDYLRVLMLRFDKSGVGPGFPWHTLTVARRFLKEAAK